VIDSGLARFALGVEYDGSEFHGWQAQQGVRTVQECLEQALSRVADHAIRVHCAGRTDSGVHGLQQVVHFDSHAARSERSWILGTTVNLPPDIGVIWAKKVPAGFHARYCATARHYRYIIANRLTRPAIQRQRQVWCHWPLDVMRMRQAARDLIGEHDFSSYRAQGCQAKSPVRRVTRLDISRQDDLVIIEVSANGFLHHMVRNMAGVLMAIGQGDQPVNWARQVLEHRDRSLGGVTAPPEGLYLLGVTYPPEFNLPPPLSL
jgi:tRNA pseudouridine38-40 synthase